jgi:hypothetical protein
MRPANTKPLSRHCAGTRLIVQAHAVSWRQALPNWAGSTRRAQKVELFLVGNPHFTTRHWATTEPFRDAATLEHFIDGYREAGLPE